MKEMKHFLRLCVALLGVGVFLPLSAGAATQLVTGSYYWMAGSETTTSSSGQISPVSAYATSSGFTADFTANPGNGKKALNWYRAVKTPYTRTDSFEYLGSGDEYSWEYDKDIGNVILGLEIDWIEYAIHYQGVETISEICWTNKITIADCPTKKTGYTFAGAWTNEAGKVFKTGEVVSGTTFEITNNDDEAVVTLFPTWTPNTYTLTLDQEGGSGGTESVTATYEAALPDITVPTRDHHTFNGYWDEPSGIGTQYYTAEGTGVAAWKETSDKTLYASWTEFFLVTWKEPTTFGSAIIKEEYVEEGGTSYEPATPQHDGYTFDKWSGNGEEIHANRTITAQYKANEYRIYFEANDGKGTKAESEIHTYDPEKEKNLRKNTFVRTGYTFLGWGTNSTEGVVVYTDGASVKNLSTGDDFFLFAVWKANDYTVTFDPGAGTGEMDDQSFVYDQAQALANNTFTNGNLDFLGWTDSNGVRYEDGAVVSNLTDEAEGIVTMTARWAQTYRVAFNGNGATNETQMADQVFESPDDEQNLSSNRYGKVGYTFAGWATEEEGEVVYGDGQKVKGLAEAGEKVTLFAVWKPISYCIDFAANGGTVTNVLTVISATYDEEVVLPDGAAHLAPVRPDIECFGGWKDAGNDRTYASGATVSNLCTEAGATNVLTAVWKLDVGEWSEHIHCTNLRWSVRERGWNIPWEQRDGSDWGANASGASVTQDGKAWNKQDWLQVAVPTNGTLTFQCRWHKEVENSTQGEISIGLVNSLDEATFHDGTFYGGDMCYTSIVVRAAGEWIESRVQIPLHEDQTQVVIRFASYLKEGDYLELDQVTWVPEGGAPAPTPVYAETDTPIETFSATGSALAFAFSGEGETYHLLGTNDLTSPMPWPVMFVTNVTGKALLTIPIPPDLPMMFYRLRAVKE